MKKERKRRAQMPADDMSLQDWAPETPIMPEESWSDADLDLLLPQEEKVYPHSIFKPRVKQPNFILSVLVNTVRILFVLILAAGLALVGLIALVIWLIVKYRRRNDPEYIHKDPPHIVALRKLDKYRGNAMWVPEKQKDFYSGVTDALREYISDRYGVSAMEMTTAEIFEDMKATDAPKELLDELKSLFERADFVKFAKFVASDEDNASTLPLAVRFVTATYQADVENAQEEESKGGE